MNEVIAEVAYVWHCPHCGGTYYRSLYNLAWEADLDIILKETCEDCLQNYKVVISLNAWQS